jgi:hypothetical protein
VLAALKPDEKVVKYAENQKKQSQDFGSYS